MKTRPLANHSNDDKDCKDAANNYKGASLEEIDFKNENLENTDFTEAKMVDVQIGDTAWFSGNQPDMSSATFYKAILINIMAKKAKLEGAAFISATLKSSYLVSANAKNTNFTSATVTECNLQSAELENATFDKTSVH